MTAAPDRSADGVFSDANATMRYPSEMHAAMDSAVCFPIALKALAGGSSLFSFSPSHRGFRGHCMHLDVSGAM